MPSSLSAGSKLEDLCVVGQFRDGRVTPGIALALFLGQAQLAADVAVQVFGSGFGSLDGQAVGEIGLGVIAGGLQAVKALGGFLADGHNLESDHVHVAGVDRGKVIRQAQEIAIGLAREGEAGQFFAGEPAWTEPGS